MWSAARSEKISMILCMPERVSGGDAEFQGFCNGWNKWEGQETALTGRVEMDDAYLGGVRSGGKRGRGATGKTPFVAAVSTSPEGRPRKVKLAPVKGFRKCEIGRGAKHWLAPGAAVVTDGLTCGCRVPVGCDSRWLA